MCIHSYIPCIKMKIYKKKNCENRNTSGMQKRWCKLALKAYKNHFYYSQCRLKTVNTEMASPTTSNLL